MPHDVFISYAAEDKAIADAVCAKIEERRIRCWTAPRNILPGETYAEAIIDAIDASRIMVLVFSSHANASKHVMREVRTRGAQRDTYYSFSNRRGTTFERNAVRHWSATLAGCHDAAA